MKRYKYTLIWDVLLCVFMALSCSVNQDIKTDHHNVISLKDKEITSKKKNYIGWTKSIKSLNDSIIIALKLEHDTIFDFINVYNGESLGMYIKQGLKYGKVCFSGNDIIDESFYLKNGNNLEFFKYAYNDQNRIIANHVETFSFKIKRRSIGFYLNINNSTFLLDITGRGHKESIILYDIVSNLYHHCFEQITSYSKEYFLTIKHDKSRLACMHYNKNTLQIFSLEGELIKQIKIDQADKNGQGRYAGIYASNEFIYCCYNERLINNLDEETMCVSKIHIWNWEGDIVGSIDMGESLLGPFIVNKEDNIIYALDNTRERLIRLMFKL